MAVTPLKTDNSGQSLWIEREGAQMDAFQFARELIQNAGEAGADTMWVDSWVDPDTGHKLLRFTDDGSGMDKAALTKHMKTLHYTGKTAGANYGVGARLASLYANHAGVSFASRCEGAEALVKLVKEAGVYGIYNFEVLDDEGYTVKTEAIAPDQGELSKLGKKPSGTAVILHGNGRADTWTPTVAYKLASWLSNRYWTFPNNLTVKVATSSASGGSTNTLTPFGAKLAKQATDAGTVPFVADGLVGSVTWAILDPKRSGKFQTQVAAGVGISSEGELFKYSREHSGDFGLIYKAVASRVVLMVQVSGAQMTTNRASVYLPAGHGDAVPWKRIGAAFLADLPDEIQALIDAVRPAARSLDDATARALDEEWMKKLLPVPVPVPAAVGEPETGDELGEATPEGEETEPAGSTSAASSGTHAPKRAAAGDKPAQRKPKVVTPTVQFVEEIEGDGPIKYFANNNIVHVLVSFAPYVRDVARWSAETDHPVTVVENAVQTAYAVELAATIVDANGQNRYGIAPEMVALMKEPAALYAKCLGVQSIEKTIEANLAAIVAGL
jgi:hypothetical protein